MKQIKTMKNFFQLSLLMILTFACGEAKDDDSRYPILLNMVHHNPGEPLFTTQYNDVNYLKELGYNGQVPKFEIQCAVSYDDYEARLVPYNTPERMWIERKAHDLRIQLDKATKAGMPIYPFTDVLVVPQSVMQKYGEEMSIDGRLSIQSLRTQEILKAQIAEIFKLYPELGGLTIRFGETYLHDTPFHTGTRPVYSAEDHITILNILREEVCVKRDKKLFYRTWDWGKLPRKLHLDTDVYLKVCDAVEPHSNLYFSTKHVQGDFLRGHPFNKTIGIGNHQQIVEVSINQAGMYGRNAHPYYIGKGVIDGWPEMEEKKGLRDLYDAEQVKGVWTWTWGDGWFGPYFGNELWMNLNEYVIREFAKNPLKTEEELFYEYANEQLKLTSENAYKLRELCLLSVDAVFKGQATAMQFMPPWWIRDHFFSAQDMSIYVNKGIAEAVLREKKDNLKTWYKMEDISKNISMPNKEDEEFLRVSTTYGRIKYELIELIFRTQIMFAQMEKGKSFDANEAKLILKTYDEKWDEWLDLKRNHTCCPTLYVDYASDHCQGNEPFNVSIDKLKKLLNQVI